MESSPAAAILTLATMLANVVAATTPAARAGAVTTTTSGGAASTSPEFQPIAETPPAVVHVKPAVEPPAVQVTVVGAKAMHKTLKGSNEVTALLFVGAAEDEAAVKGVAPIHPALKGLVSQFEDSVFDERIEERGAKFQADTQDRVGGRQ